MGKLVRSIETFVFVSNKSVLPIAVRDTRKFNSLCELPSCENTDYLLDLQDVENYEVVKRKITFENIELTKEEKDFIKKKMR